MNANLCCAVVVNAAFYVLQQLSRLYFAIVAPAVAFQWPENGPYWFRSYAIGMIIIAFLILLWTMMLPIKHRLGQSALHLLMVGTAALNLAFAVGIHGWHSIQSERDFADTPRNQILRDKHHGIDVSHRLMNDHLDRSPQRKTAD